MDGGGCSIEGVDFVFFVYLLEVVGVWIGWNFFEYEGCCVIGKWIVDDVVVFCDLVDICGILVDVVFLIIEDILVGY